MQHPSALSPLSAALSPKSAWQVPEIEAFVGASRLPLRVSSIDTAGFPHITSLWFLYREGRFYCCTQRQALVSRHVLANPRVGIELAVNAPPYQGISAIGTATVQEAGAAELLDTLLDRYLEGRDARLRKWLLSRVATEVLIEIVPQRLTSWDFSRRMSKPAVSPDPASAPASSGA